MRALVSKATALAFLVLAGTAGFGAMAAGPEPGVPPSPFFPDYFTGTVLVQGQFPAQGTQLVACIDDCDKGFASAPVAVGELGSFSGLVVGPKDESLAGRPVRFYIVNEYGRITAAESVPFSGELELRRMSLTFRHPVPSLATAPAPPPVGDWLVPVIPGVALAAGVVSALAGAWLLLSAQRRSYRWARAEADEETRRRAGSLRVPEIGEGEAPAGTQPA